MKKEKFVPKTDKELVESFKKFYRFNANETRRYNPYGYSDYESLERDYKDIENYEERQKAYKLWEDRQSKIRREHEERCTKLLKKLQKTKFLTYDKEKDGYYHRVKYFDIKFEKGVFIIKHLVKEKNRGVATFDINKGVCTKNGREVNSLTSFFIGYTVGYVGKDYMYSYSDNDDRTNIFRDIQDSGEYGEFLCKNVIRRFYTFTNHAYKNFGMILPYLHEFENMFNWQKEGLKVHCITNVKPKVLPKSFRNLIVEADIEVTKEMFYLMEKDAEYFKNLLILLKDEQIPYIARGEYGRDENQWKKLLESENLYNLVKQEGYQLKAVIRYLFNYLIPYEQLTIKTGVEMLRDYASMHRQMGVSLNNSSEGAKRFPKYLKSMHDIVQGEYKNYRKTYEEDIFASKVEKRFAHKKMVVIKVRADEETDLIEEKEVMQYCVEVPKKTDDLKEEGKNLNHCVGSYIDRIMRGETQILFLRKEEGRSLVTLEVRGNVLIQAKGKNNRAITKEESSFIKDFAKEKELLVRI